MIIKFRRFKYITINNWRISIIHLLCVFVFVTVFATAYLHGLIELDSNRVVIKIAPSQLKLPDGGDELNRLLDDNDYMGGVDSFQRRLNPKNNVLLKIEPNVFKRRHVLEEDSSAAAGGSAAWPNSNRLDKNVTNFFMTISRVRKKLLDELSNRDIDELIKMRSSYLLRSKSNERFAPTTSLNNSEIVKKEMDRVAEENNYDPVLVKSNLFKSNATHTDINLEYQQQLKPITRDVLVKFLKLEKFKLQKLKKIKTVKMLLDEFILDNELNKNELPEIWNKYFVYINELELYNDTNMINEILNTIATSPVTNCYEKEKGTQIKLVLSLEDGTDVLVKPMRVPRDYETPPDHFYFVDFERHHAEIAAFHVDRLLGFNRVPPTVGRVFNMSSDLWEKSEEDLAKTFFYSPAGNICFTGHCSYYCDTTHAVCGKPKDRMEGSVQLMLPSKPIMKWQVFNHPYRRTYTKRKKALWEVDDNYCVNKLFQDLTYHSKLLLDLMDMAVFDFLIGNMDRHHYEKMISLGNDTFLLHLDNGRSFGKAFHDEMSILAPLRQCCLLRYSTYERLKYLYMNRFSKLLDKSLRNDPLYPVLTDAHLRSLDRRMNIVFNELIKCTRQFEPHQVIVDDGY